MSMSAGLESQVSVVEAEEGTPDYCGRWRDKVDGGAREAEAVRREMLNWRVLVGGEGGVLNGIDSQGCR